MDLNVAPALTISHPNHTHISMWMNMLKALVHPYRKYSHRRRFCIYSGSEYLGYIQYIYTVYTVCELNNNQDLPLSDASVFTPPSLFIKLHRQHIRSVQQVPPTFKHTCWETCWSGNLNSILRRMKTATAHSQLKTTTNINSNSTVSVIVDVWGLLFPLTLALPT